MIEATDGETTEVYAPPSGWTVEDLERTKPYLASVNGVVPYGVFVDVTDHVSGLVHESNLEGEYDIGEELVVALESVQENGDIAFREVPVRAYAVTELVEEPDHIACANVEADDGRIAIEGRVAQIKQTRGPTIFHITDGSGVMPCASFVEAGVRAHPEAAVGDLVRIVGEPARHAGGLQIEVDDFEIAAGAEAEAIGRAVDERLRVGARPPAIDTLVSWSALDALADPLEELAELLRKAVLEHRPILIRHHADGDGMCAAVPVTQALERFIERHHGDPGAAEYLVRRAPSRAPYYEMEDSTRDLNRALRDQSEHGQRLPLLLMLDNGSTAEDVPGYRNLAHYDIPIAVVDHHHPDQEAVGDLLAAHVNPYLVGEDYSVTTGMLCVELARMIDPDITDRVTHVPAVAGLADRSEAEAMSAYLRLAEEAGYAREAISRVGDALDYASHWLRYSPGEPVIRDVMGLRDDHEPHRDLVALFSDRAREAVASQLEASLPHVRSERLANGARLHRIDLDAHAHRFEYPAPGRTTGAIHDHKAETEREPTITIGYGPDFCVLRSDGVRLDIPDMVDELQAEVVGAGVTGGGHLVVGSIKFVPGRRAQVINALVDKMADADLDESLTSTPPSADLDD